MSYRAHLNFKTKDNEFAYQLLRNDNYFEKIINYVTNGNKIKYQELEDNDFALYKFKINDFWDFCMKVIIPVAKRESEDFKKFHNIANKDDTYISLGRLFQRKNEKSDKEYLKSRYIHIRLTLMDDGILEFYNLIDFIIKNDLISLYSFELKPNIEIFLEAY